MPLVVADDMSTLQFRDAVEADIIFSDHRLMTAIALAANNEGLMYMHVFNIEFGTGSFVWFVSGGYCGIQPKCQRNQVSATSDTGVCKLEARE